MCEEKVTMEETVVEASAEAVAEAAARYAGDASGKGCLQAHTKIPKHNIPD